MSQPSKGPRHGKPRKLHLPPVRMSADGFPSIEERVNYDLWAEGVDDPRLLRWLVEPIVRLPEEIGIFAIERCRFVSAGRVNLGMVLPAMVGRSATETEGERPAA